MRLHNRLIAVCTVVIPVTISGCTMTGQHDATEFNREKQQAWTDLRSNSFDSAIGHYQQAVDLARQLDNPLELADTLADLGRACISSGDSRSSAAGANAQAAQADYQHALASYTAAVHQYQTKCTQLSQKSSPTQKKGMGANGETDVYDGLCRSLQGEGDAYRKLGQLQNAKILYEQARAVAKQKGLSDQWRRIALEYIQLLKDMGKPDEAQAAAREVESMSAVPELPHGPDQLKYYIHEHLKKGMDAQAKGDFVSAEMNYANGYRASVALNDKNNMAGFATRLGITALSRGDAPRAEGWFNYALTICTIQRGPAKTAMTAMRGLVLTFNQQKRFAEAEGYAKQQVDLTEKDQASTPADKRRAWTDLANAYAGEGKSKQAIELFEKCYQTCKETMPIASAETAVTVCDLSDAYARFRFDQENRRLLHTYINEVSREKRGDPPTVAKLFEERAQSHLKAGDTTQGKLLASTAQVLMEHHSSGADTKGVN